MAVVLYADGESREIAPGAESLIKAWISPSTMDSADTMVLPTITGKTVRVLSCFDATTGDAVTCTLSTQTVTIDAAGATANHVYHLMYTYI